MKHCIIFIFHCILVKFLIAQKPAIGLNDCGIWPQISDEAISSDGKFVLFKIDAKNSDPHLVIQSTDHSYKNEIPGAKDAAFTDDAKHVIFITQGDSLCILDLNTLTGLFVPNIQSYKIAENDGQSYLAMLQASNDLLLYNLTTSVQKKYLGVNDYIFDNEGRQLLLQKTQNKDSVHRSNLELVDLEKGAGKIIWEGERSSNYAFSKAGTSIAFIAETKVQKSVKNAIWIYQRGSDWATLLLDDQGLRMNDSFCVAKNNLQFSPDEQKLFFSLKRNEDNNATALKNVGVHIWNYQDSVLTPATEFWNSQEKYRFYSAVVNLNAGDKKIVQLDEKKNLARGVQLINGGNNYIMAVSVGNVQEISWNPSARSDLYLISTKDGSIKYIKRHLSFLVNHKISPEGKYVLWFDIAVRAYFIYNIERGTIKNISKNIPTIYREGYDGSSYPSAYGPAAWLENDESVLLYDRYDIWRVDPEGLKPPENITQGQGRKSKTVFRYVYCKGGNVIESPPLAISDSILLCAFDETNKFNGFYKIKIGSQKPPVKLSMSPDVYYFPAYKDGLMEASFLLKAKKADVYLLKRMNAGEYPNLQITTNFRTFTPLTDLNPQKKFNWLTSALINWKTFKGKDAQGILYKPENFDPQKKYPVIFYFYERLSGSLNSYLEPQLSTGDLNIPFLVSQGYLVFCPDIHYTVGDPGESAYDYVVSAAKMLSTKSWVDAKHMGIQGHSWGGYQVNYLVTRTSMFAAAAAGAGNSNFISRYGSILGTTYSDSHQFVEKGQNRMGVTLWQDPSRYIRNSPIFGADKVNTPLLIMHNKNDMNVPWTQGLEFFTGLRRLNKKVWMLQYDKGGHSLNEKDDKIDYTTRLKQYFDHYLKDAPAPRWMMKELPSNETGYALDPSLNCGKECKVCKMWNEKMKKDPAATIKEIEQKTKTEHWMGSR
nr:prolyl oligopeptidase family serine peptidase [uncultured Sediminibacterium sp.]